MFPKKKKKKSAPPCNCRQILKRKTLHMYKRILKRAHGESWPANMVTCGFSLCRITLYIYAIYTTYFEKNTGEYGNLGVILENAMFAWKPIENLIRFRNEITMKIATKFFKCTIFALGLYYWPFSVSLLWSPFMLKPADRGMFWQPSHMLPALCPMEEEWQVCNVCQNSLESLAGLNLKPC